MHESAWRFIVGTIMSFGVEDQLVLDLGGRDINGTVHGQFTRRPTVVDIADGPGVDVVADAADWTPDQTYDAVLCTEVFEHTPRWREIIGTAHLALRPGGLLIATCATSGRPPHGAATDKPLDGEYYQNVTRDELGETLGGWATGMARVADGVFTQDDLYAWAVK